MEECDKCSDGTMVDGKYTCTASDYRLIALDANLIVKAEDHDIPSNDYEVTCNALYDIKYCSCGNYWA